MDRAAPEPQIQLTGSAPDEFRTVRFFLDQDVPVEIARVLRQSTLQEYKALLPRVCRFIGRLHQFGVHEIDLAFSKQRSDFQPEPISCLGSKRLIWRSRWSANVIESGPST
jgi:hypothetical protein